MPASGQEIEAKFFIQDFNKINLRLHQLEARLIQKKILETNIRFDQPDGGLRAEGRVLRLRQDYEARLTYKSASNNNDGVLSRTEIEFAVGDFEKAKQFLEALGYETIFVYEKYRTVYSINPSEGLKPSEGSIHIMLDELPYGNFVEIEGESVETIRKISDALGLHWNTAIAKSYHALFNHLKAQMKLSFRDLLFQNFRDIRITPAQLGVHPADE